MELKKIMVLMLVFCGSTVSLSAQHQVFIKSGKAIQGYDPVAYFKEGEQVKGSKGYSHQWKEATWFFASEENLEDFKADPEKYAPQYGGYCAYGMAKGYKANTSPEAWTILDDKLYLNYDIKVRELWNADRPGFIKQADANWPTVKDDKD